MFFSYDSADVRDSHALGAEGIARFDNIVSMTKETAQAACDTAQKEVDAKTESSRKDCFGSSSNI